MARMHSRKHGKHGSKKPAKHLNKELLTYDKEETEKLINKLAKEGKTSSQIGFILRDQYGVPDVRYFKMKISETMGAPAKGVPEDLYNLLVKAVNLHRHMIEKRKDTKGTHGLELLESKIRRLGKYYARSGKLKRDWKYDIEEAKLLVK
jgi:small subunit ribosomal protein S15